jgi:hypothetical protein
MKIEKITNNPDKLFTARYDYVTGEIQGLVPGHYEKTDYSVIATPEIISDPRQWRYDFTINQMVKKPQVEIDEILRTREEWKIRAGKKDRIVEEVDLLKKEVEDLKQKLILAGLSK